jgi:hypothetical protein
MAYTGPRVACRNACGSQIIPRRHAGWTGLCAECLSKERQAGNKPSPASPPERTVDSDLARRSEGSEVKRLRGLYEQSLKTIEDKNAQLSGLGFLQSNITHHRIHPNHPAGTGEGTVFAALSDWHSEEEVTLQQTSGRNQFNLDIARQRADGCFQAIHRLTKLVQQDIKVENLILGLLGDFITNGDLHDGDQRENTLLGPTHAVVFAQDLLVSGIEFLLNHTKLKITLPCHSGNHARTGRKIVVGHENSHSLEFLLYKTLAAHFRHEGDRVQFMVPDSQDSVVEVYGVKTRFQHGHAIKFQGGVGGLTIPANKAIDIWNATEKVDLDVFGHYHQSIDAGHFFSNGSLIGYNAFAKWIKARYERPRQNFWLLDKKRGRTCSWPIYFNQ